MPAHSLALADDPISTLLDRLALQVDATIQTPDATAVHHLRVAIRRLAQGLALPALSPPARRKITRRLKSLLALAGAVRDCDICLEILPARAAPRAAVRAHRKSAAASLVSTLQRWVARDWAARWRQAVAESGARPPAEPLPETAHRQLHRRAKRFFRLGNRAAAHQASGGELHRVRIAAKKFRYRLELFQPLYGTAADEFLARIRAVQTLLGEINDCRTVRALLHGLGGAPEVEAALRQKQQRKSREFRRLWEKSFGEGAGGFTLTPQA